MTLRQYSLVCFLLISIPAAGQEKPEPLRGLLITGGCCHDYENQKRIITEGMSQRVNIVWDVVHEGGTGRDHKISVYSDQNWAKKYDVIFHNECFGGVKDDKFVSSIAAAHHAGFRRSSCIVPCTVIGMHLLEQTRGAN